MANWLPVYKLFFFVPTYQVCILSTSRLGRIYEEDYLLIPPKNCILSTYLFVYVRPSLPVVLCDLDVLRFTRRSM